MALGTYQINEAKMDSWLQLYNGTIKNGLAGNIFTGWVNAQFFGSNPIALENVLGESGAVQTLPSGTNILVEQGTGAVVFTPNGQSNLVDIQSPGNVYLTDVGGGPGDFIVDTNNADSIKVEQGNNTVIGGSGYDTLQGGGGTDILVGGGHSWLSAGTGAHQILVGGIVTGAMDTLIGGSNNDLLRTFKGDNSLVGGSGLNTLIGGAGDDTLVGGGQSRLYAGTGSQDLIGGTAAGGHDTLYGSTQHPGTETLTTSFGNNWIITGTGFSTVNSGGDDAIGLVRGNSVVNTTGSNADTIYFGGHSGDDTVHAGSGDDTILIQHTEQIAKIQSDNGATTLSFKDGQTLTYTGNHVTVTFNGF